MIYPLLHHGYMRGEGAESLGIPLSIATPAEALELMLLSLSGDASSFTLRSYLQA